MILKVFLAITIIFIPYMYLDTRAEQIINLKDTFPYGLLSVPTFYLLINLISIYCGFKYFKANLDIETSSAIKGSLPEVEKNQEHFFKKINLTNREKELVLLLMKGYTYNQLADELVISLATVKTHVYNIYRKAEVKNKIELFNLINGDENK
jgi:DNA-binding NarL/FixJ family response regulator